MGTATPTVGRQILVGAVLLAVVAFVAVVGSLATLPNTDGWYADVVRAPWSPPNWLFGPAWSVLYLLIAVSGFLTWRTGFAGNRKPNRARTPLILYSVQMVLNFAWTPVFFAGYPIVGETAWWAALVVIVLLIVAVFVLVVSTWKLSRTAAWLLVPYLAWLTFASTLNAAIIALN